MDIFKQFGTVVRDAIRGLHTRVDTVESGFAHEVDDVRSEVNDLRSKLEAVLSEVGGLKSEIGSAVETIQSATPDGLAPTSPDAQEETQPAATPAPDATPADAPSSPDSGDQAPPAAAAASLAPVVGADSTVVKVPSSGTTVTLDHATGSVSAVHDASQTPVEPDPAAVQAARDATSAAGVAVG
jgi:hypothetical protein